MISIENLGTGLKRDITVDKSGHYTFAELPTGDYRVTSGGTSHDVHVAVGSGARVSFAGAAVTQMEAIQVRGASVNPIDVSTVESTTVFSSTELHSLPVRFDPTEVALLAPGTVRADPAFKDVPSFGGASPAENGYYVNGFDVTNIRTFISYAHIPFNAIAEEQVKTGGYGAEYGRSLGGVISVVTMRGGNDWHVGGSIYAQPNFFRETSPNVVDKAAGVDPNVYGNYSQTADHKWRTASDGTFNSANTSDTTHANAYISGPLIKDHLFVFAMLEGKYDTWDNYGYSSSTHNWSSRPQGLVKLDWNITDKHILEFTGFNNKDTTHTQNFANYDTYNGFPDFATSGTFHPYATSHDAPTSTTFSPGGGYLGVLKYTGYLTDDLTLSAQYGKLKQLDSTAHPRNDAALQTCPFVYDGRGGALVREGCAQYITLGEEILDTAPPDPSDSRKAGRLDVEWRLGSHTLKAGYDGEKFTSTALGGSYTYYRYYHGTHVNGVDLPAGTDEYVRVRHFGTNSGSYEVDNTAAYIEDNWKLTDRWLIYAGLRNETFNNKNRIGQSFAKENSLIAPRLGFSWDMTGDSVNKLSGTAGRYYIPISSDLNIRATAGEYWLHDYYTFTSIDPRTWVPTLGTHLGDTAVIESGNVPNAHGIVASDLKPMSQDEVILAFEHAFSDAFSAGTRGVWRKVNNGMDDTCRFTQPNAAWGTYYDPWLSWANDHGYSNFDESGLAQCVVVNPGRDNTFMLDLNGDGKLVKAKIPNSYFGLPTYKRRYNALEFFFEHPWDGKWQLQGSYTWSHSYGTSEGYAESNIQQDDPGISQSFDWRSYEAGDYGNLPNDRRHTIKLFGRYSLTKNWEVSGNLIAQSGRPLSCFGNMPITAIDMPGWSPSSGNTFYCNTGVAADGTPIQTLMSRGTAGHTPWIYPLDVGIQWAPDIDAGKLSFRADVYNIFNQQRAVRINQDHDYIDAASGALNLNPNYHTVDNYQSPRYVQLTARYDF